MNTQTKRLLNRIGTVTAAIVVTLGVAGYGSRKLNRAAETAVQESQEQVIILDAGHGGSC